MHRLQSSAGGDGQCLPGSLVEGLCNILWIGAIILVKIWLTARQEFSPPCPNSPILLPSQAPPSLAHTLPASGKSSSIQIPLIKHPNSHHLPEMSKEPFLKAPSSWVPPQAARIRRPVVLLAMLRRISAPRLHQVRQRHVELAAKPPGTRLRSPPLIQARSRGGKKMKEY